MEGRARNVAAVVAGPSPAVLQVCADPAHCAAFRAQADGRLLEPRGVAGDEHDLRLGPREGRSYALADS